VLIRHVLFRQVDPRDSANFKGETVKRKYIQLMFVITMLVAIGFSSPTARADAAPQRIEITAKRFAFEPGQITLKKGQPVVLVVKSTDVAHGIRFRDLNLEVKVGAHGTSEVQFTPEKTGEFVGHCSVFCGRGHGEMVLTLHVVD
jgi:cytochrome c oxidase subunit II